MSRRHVIQDSDDKMESTEEEEEEEEDVGKSYARLQANRLAEGCNKKVRAFHI